MVCDLGQRHFEKIEAAVQISYGVSLAHRSKNRTRPCYAAEHAARIARCKQNAKNHDATLAPVPISFAQPARWRVRRS
jgi:hypothetical protein